ncbi:unnamed protein product [Acanthocheilonema viteae]|uniref:PDZ domain-containing protein n=1 Tax=Acanthocheilonema viteae TaxID=6277 RepID=A0A498SR84_ACAVI|nr:unnamed protein product [Acanthocheilonema viteae]
MRQMVECESITELDMPSCFECGYNLHAEKNKPQFIGAINAGSPTDRSSLRQGDGVFIVNGHCVVGEDTIR